MIIDGNSNDDTDSAYDHDDDDDNCHDQGLHYKNIQKLFAWIIVEDRVVGHATFI